MVKSVTVCSSHLIQCQLLRSPTHWIGGGEWNKKSEPENERTQRDRPQWDRCLPVSESKGLKKIVTCLLNAIELRYGAHKTSDFSTLNCTSKVPFHYVWISIPFNCRFSFTLFFFSLWLSLPFLFDFETISLLSWIFPDRLICFVLWIFLWNTINFCLVYIERIFVDLEMDGCNCTDFLSVKWRKRQQHEKTQYTRTCLQWHVLMTKEMCARFNAICLSR